MTVHHEPGSAVICNVCVLADFGHDQPVEYISTRALLAAAKAAGWKRRRVKVEAHGHVWNDTQDVCPACQAKEAEAAKQAQDGK